MDLPDPPGHTVFLYLQDLNRKELQKQAKAYEIKANQKNEVLRQKLQEVLTASKGNASTQTPVKRQGEATKTAEATTQTPERGDEEPAWKIASHDVLEPKNQENQSNVNFAPSTKTYNKTPTIIKTPTSRRVLGERNMNTRRPLTSSDNSKSTGNAETTKPTKPCTGTPGTVRDVSKIIKTKNSPIKPSSTTTVTYNSKPLLLTHNRPRPKPMAMSKRNEIQYQKFLERQNKGRKVREQKLKMDEFIHLVRSPVRARS
jgi:hypothetical protein